MALIPLSDRYPEVLFPCAADRGASRIHPWMHRAPSIAPGTFLVAQPLADCIMPGFIYDGHSLDIAPRDYPEKRGFDKSGSARATGDILELVIDRNAARLCQPHVVICSL
jgi:hypothetical protein